MLTQEHKTHRIEVCQDLLATSAHIAKFGWTVLPHPPYSPGLAPSDFHLFGPMKD
ncbi:hypothetical protein B7P43_G06250 [Cryptotermes secundus]|uniref:Histone-lysine N-methyltransferase SETMAR n=1 Tax=Cryptotermes secundus TaxID=105785 RepID=A0A2J7PQH8_9NEOP|nr:hypothetical protein B7P43_G06250 [Cryptotermes secundus]